MHGSGSRFGTILVVISAVCAGCEESPLPPAPVSIPSADTGTAFDAGSAGTITGSVCWEGAVPKLPPYDAPVSPAAEQAGGARKTWNNPNLLQVEPGTHGVGNAVVFLRGVDPRRSRPWDLPPVRVAIRDYQFQVSQGASTGPYGFVRRGAEVKMASEQLLFHILQARGAGFFSFTFPVGGQACRRTLSRSGVVELTSGTGCFWMRSYLFVDDHPYYVRTDHAGRFTLPQVPAGTYDLVCWLPSWHEAEHERDADTGLVCRLSFRPPLVRTQTVTVRAGKTTTGRFQVAQKDFE